MKVDQVLTLLGKASHNPEWPRPYPLVAINLPSIIFSLGEGSVNGIMQYVTFLGIGFFTQHNSLDSTMNQ